MEEGQYELLKDLLLSELGETVVTELKSFEELRPPGQKSRERSHTVTA